MEKQYDPTALEPRWARVWEEEGLFAPQDGDGEPFVITLPPPNVTGVLHIGHCLGASVMDCLMRHYRMRGHPALFVPGTDHASIATESKLVNQLASEGLSRDELGRDAFLERAWKWSDEHHDRIVSQFKRFGASLDWDREAFTMDEKRSRAVAETFVRLHEKGLIYRGDYLVNWSVAQQSAVSDEEVEHREVQSNLWHLRYPLTDGGFLSVATTRPETMLGDTAVAIHPDDPKTAHLRGKTVRLPLTDREIPVIEDEHVDPEFGTGCVKVTPAHDPNDYEMGKRHGLEFITVMNKDGTMADVVPAAYHGIDRLKARKMVVKDLEAGGFLEKVEPHTHMVGYHDRSGTVIEPLISTQWFMKMEDLARPALEAVEDGTIRMFPERWIGVYNHWMRNIRDWCISRQLWWGHRIPVYTCDACEEVMVTADAPATCVKCGGGSLTQDPDVLDTWFSSWLWTFSPLGWPEQTQDLRRFHPTSALITGHEIIFFWVARMIMASYEFLGEPPFREVLFTGIVRDGKGRKMSKSLGNSPDPIDIMEQYGADALRFTLLMLTPTGQDTNFAPESIETGRNFCNKIWNATRLLFSNLEGAGLTFPDAEEQTAQADLAAGLSESDPEALFEALNRRAFGAELPPGERAALQLEDRWILHEVLAAAERSEAAIEARRLNDAAHILYDAFWHKFCDWYLEAIKPRLQGDDAAAKRTALLTALWAHGVLLRLLHPFAPFITEELWGLHPASGGFCINATLPRHRGEAPFAAEAALFDLARELVGAARNLRSEIGVPPGKRGHLILRGDAERLADLQRIQQRVCTLAKMESVAVEPAGTPPAKAAGTVVDDVELFLPMEGLIDLEKERARLNKELDGLQKRLGGVRGKLGNPKFVENAPDEVVERERSLEASLLETLGKLESQIASLK